MPDLIRHPCGSSLALDRSGCFNNGVLGCKTGSFKYRAQSSVPGSGCHFVVYLSYSTEIRSDGLCLVYEVNNVFHGWARPRALSHYRYFGNAWGWKQYGSEPCSIETHQEGDDVQSLTWLAEFHGATFWWVYAPGYSRPRDALIVLRNRIPLFGRSRKIILSKNCEIGWKGRIDE